MHCPRGRPAPPALGRLIAAARAPPRPLPCLAGPTYDLRRDAAFNLSLLYRQSGADALACQLLRQHLTV